MGDDRAARRRSLKKMVEISEELGLYDMEYDYTDRVAATTQTGSERVAETTHIGAGVYEEVSHGG